MAGLWAAPLVGKMAASMAEWTVALLAVDSADDLAEVMVDYLAALLAVHLAVDLVVLTVSIEVASRAAL